MLRSSVPLAPRYALSADRKEKFHIAVIASLFLVIFLVNHFEFRYLVVRLDSAERFG